MQYSEGELTEGYTIMPIIDRVYGHSYLAGCGRLNAEMIHLTERESFQGILCNSFFTIKGCAICPQDEMGADIIV